MEWLMLAGSEAQTLAKGLIAAQQRHERASLPSSGNGSDMLLPQLCSY